MSLVSLPQQSRVSDVPVPFLATPLACMATRHAMIRKDHLNIDSQRQRQRQDRHELCSVQCKPKLILRALPPSFDARFGAASPFLLYLYNRAAPMFGLLHLPDNSRACVVCSCISALGAPSPTLHDPQLAFQLDPPRLVDLSPWPFVSFVGNNARL